MAGNWRATFLQHNSTLLWGAEYSVHSDSHHILSMSWCLGYPSLLLLILWVRWYHNSLLSWEMRVHSNPIYWRRKNYPRPLLTRLKYLGEVTCHFCRELRQARWVLLVSLKGEDQCHNHSDWLQHLCGQSYWRFRICDGYSVRKYQYRSHELSHISLRRVSIPGGWIPPDLRLRSKCFHSEGWILMHWKENWGRFDVSDLDQQ